MLQKVGKGSVICGWVRTRPVANYNRNSLAGSSSSPISENCHHVSAGRFPPFIIEVYFSRRYLDSTHTTVVSSPGRSPPPFFFPAIHPRQ